MLEVYSIVTLPFSAKLHRSSGVSIAVRSERSIALKSAMFRRKLFEQTVSRDDLLVDRRGYR
jgi:hypothetical protein